MWEAGWAGDIAWFQFGAAVTRPDRHGTPRTVGEYALHISCPWRWLADSGFPRADETSPPASLQALGESRSRLTQVDVDTTGHLVLHFHNGDSLVLDNAPQEPGNDDVEYWRLLQPGLGTPHLVVSSSGVEWHEA